MMASELHLVGALHAPPLGAEKRRPRPTAQAAQLLEVVHPGVADGAADERGQLGGSRAATKRRGVTPLVLLLNFSGHSSWKVAQHRGFQQVGVQRGKRR